MLYASLLVRRRRVVRTGALGRKVNQLSCTEGFGEDPYLVSRIAAAMVRGYQGSDPSDPQRIMASVKHFALYGAVEGGRDYNVVDMSPMRMYHFRWPLGEATRGTLSCRRNRTTPWSW